MAQFRHGLCVFDCLYCISLCVCVVFLCLQARAGLSLYFTQTMSVAVKYYVKKSVENREREMERERGKLNWIPSIFTDTVEAHKSVLEAKSVQYAVNGTIHITKTWIFHIVHGVRMGTYSRTLTVSLFLSFRIQCTYVHHDHCIHTIHWRIMLRVQIYSRCLFFRSKWARAVYVIYLLFIIKHLIKQYWCYAVVCTIHFTLIVADRKQYWPRFSVSLFFVPSFIFFFYSTHTST